MAGFKTHTHYLFPEACPECADQKENFQISCLCKKKKKSTREGENTDFKAKICVWLTSAHANVKEFFRH